jgi:hypothetical protein
MRGVSAGEADAASIMTANNGCFPDEKNVLDINNLPVAVFREVYSILRRVSIQETGKPGDDVQMKATAGKRFYQGGMSFGFLI